MTDRRHVDFGAELESSTSPNHGIGHSSKCIQPEIDAITQPMTMPEAPDVSGSRALPYLVGPGSCQHEGDRQIGRVAEDYRIAAPPPAGGMTRISGADP